jgi:pSer/pThr/pTyr-binding forkhead associated (FHA) protein
MAVTLHCTAGPLAGELITVESELLLGREVPDVGRLGDDLRLSRRHARLFFDSEDRAMIEDLGSTNGTWVNGDRVHDPRVLMAGDEIRLGQTTFQVRPGEQSDATRVRPVLSTTRPAHGGTSDQPRLAILDGPNRGAEIALGDELLLGRSYGEPGALGGDRKLSRRHARIARAPGGVYFIEDTGSTNGTLVNGAPLRGTNLLRSGDEIEVGSSSLQTHGLPDAPVMDDLEEPPATAPAAVAEPAVAEPAAAAEPAVAAPAQSLAAFEPQGAAGARLSSRRLTAAFAAVFALAAAAAAAAVFLTAPLGSRQCPQGFVCHKPPAAPALHALSTFRGSLGWGTEYDPQLATPVTQNVAGNQLTLRESNAQDRVWGANPGSQIIAVVLRAFSARKVSPQAGMQNLLGSLGSQLVGAAAAPSSDQIFANPVLGLHPAQGQVVEGNLKTAQGPGGLVKLAVLGASSGGVTIAAAVVYPVQQGQSQQNNPDQPLDTFGDQILETVRFPSDGAV